jgi:tRNA threonylcarbamoyladenosine biosynthesis protein TsaB
VILAFDTATPVTTAAVLRRDGRAFEAHDEPPSDTRGRHASRLLVLIEGVLAEAAIGWEEIGRIAVGVGPGGFTGLRIGIATARALAQARGLDLVPVGSLEALAAGAAATESAAEPTATIPVAAVIDARRGEVFAAVYAPDGAALLAPAALAPEALAERLAGFTPRPLAVGDGAIRFAAELASAGAAVPPAGASVHRLSAVHTCRLGAEREPVDRDALLPAYLREPDAKPSVIQPQPT